MSEKLKDRILDLVFICVLIGSAHFAAAMFGISVMPILVTLCLVQCYEMNTKLSDLKRNLK